MNLDLLHDANLHRNRLLRAAGQLLTTPPGDPVLGEFLFAASGAAVGPLHWLVYDGVSGQGSGSSLWAVLAGLNRNESATGLWTWNPVARGAGTADGEKAPFVVGANSVFDPAGRLRNLVASLNADYLDGRGALEYVGTSAPSNGFVPVYGGTGQLACADPVNDYDAVNKKTWQAGLTGMIVLAPCRVASSVRFAGTRAGNVITASANGALVVDGVSVAVSDRVLLKDQQSGGTAVDNGVFTVTATGSAGAPAVLTRATDADATGELTIGALVYINEGTANRATQWSCQHASGETGGSIDINVQQQNWTKSFQQSAYTAGRGLVLSGLEFNFAQNADYTAGSIFWANAPRTVTPLLPPASNLFLRYSTGITQPEWKAITVADLSDWPNPIVPGTAGTAGYHPRYASDPKAIENSFLADVGGTMIAPANTLSAATVGLGSSTSPMMDLWANLLRLKPLTGTTGALGGLWGIETSPTDNNTNHKRAVVWSSSDIKSWLAITAADTGGVPTARQLTIFGTSGQITVSTANTWDLSADRTWTLALDVTTLDTRWVTRHTTQTLSGKKTWYSVTADPAETKIAMALGDTAEPTLQVRAGGAVLWGDGISPAAASIDFAGNQLRFDGRPVQFATAAVIRATSALSGQGTPVSLLGLTAADDVQRVTAADLTALVGSPTLAANAVGYGGADSRLTGDATNFRWDFANKRLGIKVTPTETLDIAGSFKLNNTVTTGSYPGAQVYATDTSANPADWTSRTLFAFYASVSKTGAATFVTSATLTSIAGVATVTAGSVTNAIAVRSILQLGAAASGPAITAAFGFYSGFSAAAGVTGSIGRLVHFVANDLPAGGIPQPAEHYGVQVPQLTSATGATRTAALRLDLTTTGIGERYNIYAPGNALNYLAGNLGLGVTTPAARLEFAVGSVTVAPARFAPTSSSSILLTVPIAGALESRGDRLTFTDTLPARHPIAHLDDLGFTNDSASEQSGAVIFGPSDRVSASLTASGYTEDLGTGDFSMWVRLMYPTAMRGPSRDAVMGLSSNSSSAVVNGGLLLQINSIGQVELAIYGATGGDSRIIKFTAAFGTYGGTIVDLVLTRTGGGTPVLYLNGVAQTTSETSSGTAPAWSAALASGYFIVGNCYSPYGSVARIHRATLFNRALSATEVPALSRVGISDMDKWGSTKAISTTDFASGLGSWTTNDGNAAFVAGQTVNGSTGWATVTRNNSDGRMDVAAPTTGVFGFRRWLGLKVRVWRAGAIPTYFCSSMSGVVTDSSAATAVGATTETDIYQVASSRAATATAQLRIEPVSSATPAASVTMTMGTVYAIKAPQIYQLGAVCDLNLGVGCGSIVPDRSGRYHGTLSGTTWTHYLPNCPTEVPSGGGTISRGLRRYTQTVAAKDGDTVAVVHGLGTSNLTVSVWNATGQSVQAAVQRKVGAETTTIEIGFALVGAPTIAVDFLVVIVG